MADPFRLPPNVRQDPNTGYYEITNSQGKTIRVNAQSQAQLDAFVRSVNTNTPIQVTQIDPTTGLSRTNNFDPQTIINDTDRLDQWRAAQTRLKRDAGIVGTSRGGYVDINTGQPLTQAQAEQRARDIGLPPDTVQALRPLDQFQVNASQRTLDAQVNQPSQLSGPDQQYNPVQPPVVAQELSPYPEPDVSLPRVESVAPQSVQTFALPPQDAIVGQALPAESQLVEVPPAFDVVETGQSTTIFFEDGRETGRVSLFSPPEVEPGPGIPRDEPQGTTTLFDDAGVTTTFFPEPVDAELGTVFAFDEAGAVVGQTTVFEPSPVAADLDPGVTPAFDTAGVQVGTTTAFSPTDVSLSTLSDAELENLLATTPQSDGGYGLLLQEYQLRGGDPLSVEIVGSGQLSEDQVAAEQAQAAADLARQQETIAAQRNQASQGDWRVKLRLAPGATYLYKDPELTQDGIMYPLLVTDGVVFPYTPQITTTYNANYTPYDLTHSNYRGYFYQSSHVGEIQLQAVFTAQDTAEANYLLAVIHFFRSVTKMFYGQDAQRGSPPPMVFLQGLGEFQFNLHPCVVSQFNYTLPAEVDYIRARTASIDGTNLLIRRDRQTLPTNPFSAAYDRLQNAGINRGAINIPPAPPTLGTASPTYVPTKIEMTMQLLPMQSRSQQSQQFSLKGFANGNLVKGGFW